MSILILSAVGYVFAKFAPIRRISELKDLFEYKETAATMFNDTSFINEIRGKISCHQGDVDSVMYTVKLLAITAIIVFMMVYSQLITGATTTYKSGLYTSNFMKNSKCCGQT
jgi:hypothetical protein